LFLQENYLFDLLRTAKVRRWAVCAASILASFSTDVIHAAVDSTIKIGADFPHFAANKKFSQDILFSTLATVSGKVQFNCYRYTGKADSILVYGMKNVSVEIKTGVSTQQLTFGPNDANSFVLPAFYDILRTCGVVPAGKYKVYIAFVADSGLNIHHELMLQADSTLPATSSLNSQLNNTLLPAAKSGIWGRAQDFAGTTVPAAKTVDRSASKINRLFKSRGLRPQTEQRNGKTLVNLWYEDWFVGRYELDATQSAAAQIQRQKAQIAGNVSSLADNDLESYRSLFSQVRELAKASKEDKELKGELAVSGNWSTGQPEYSAQDNNYYEARGRAEVEVFDIPVSVEGYYTTQDAHRQVKASYVRAHYDADRAKEKLMKLINGYRTQFNQTVSKGKGLEQVYGSYLNNLEGAKGQLLTSLTSEAGIPSVNGEGFNTEGLQAQIEAALAAKMKDTAALLQGAGGKVDSAGSMKRAGVNAARIKDSAARLYTRAMERYEEVKALEEKLRKYRALLEQYKNTTHFDSALAYDKVRSLQEGDESTYKQLAKSASGLLPEGKAKTFIAGLTSLDAGIFPKYVSKYTMGGQQLKGLDLGYDIGFAQIGVSAGSVEYAGRDGALDKYSSYSARVMFAPAKGQKAGLVYYGYMPSRSMLSGDDFFKNTDISLPSFREPVSIVSATYEGLIAKTVTVDAEAATSFRKGGGQSLENGFDADRLAWHLNAEGSIPKTPLALTGSYEHGGKDFQNSTLPINISGTDLYKIGMKGDFFRSFLTAGVEYNHMEQANFYSKGGNNRWGFEIATHSKQYPSVALSYKPFATFRSYEDTLAIPQRPLQGAVWTGKASYQIKRLGGVSYRFSAVLNRSTSTSDTVSYGADLLQLNASYTSKQWMAMVSAGQSRLATNYGRGESDSLNPAHVKTTFLMTGVSSNYSKALTLNGGADIGFAPFGLSKWGLNGGLSYRMKAAPLTARISGRYSTYRLAAYSGNVGNEDNGTETNETMSWRPLVSGSLELIWQFRMKLRE
jgi:hypothetical protein